MEAPFANYKAIGGLITSQGQNFVEAATIINTRIRTFGGKMVFVPNAKILNDYVVNYHITPNRRLQLIVDMYLRTC